MVNEIDDFNSYNQCQTYGIVNVKIRAMRIRQEIMRIRQEIVKI
jgi:hypothetical protein